MRGLSPYNPETREMVLAGEFGEKARKALEEHPDAGCGRYTPLFHCTCGNYSSKSSVFISDEDGVYYAPGKFRYRVVTSRSVPSAFQLLLWGKRFI